MEWARLIRYVNNEEALIVGEYREYTTEEHFVYEFRSDREVALLSNTLQWMKNRIEKDYQFEFEYGELGTNGFTIKIPNSRLHVGMGMLRIKREIMSMASWLYSKHTIPGEEEEEEESAIPAEPTKDKEYTTRW